MRNKLSPRPVGTGVYGGGKAITDEVVGKVGRVTGTVGPGRVGEVMLAVRGGSEHFHAYPCDAKSISVGTRVVVVEYYPPRTVIVAEA